MQPLYTEIDEMVFDEENYTSFEKTVKRNKSEKLDEGKKNRQDTIRKQRKMKRGGNWE